MLSWPKVLKEPIKEIIVKGTKKYPSYSGPSTPADVSGAKGWAWPTIYPFVITSKYGDKIYCRDYNQPKYSDTARSYMYDMEGDFHNLECFCNVFDMNGQNVVPKDRYLANIYQFNNMLEGDHFERTIKYRDLLDEEICLDNKKYVSYDDLPNDQSVNPPQE